MSLLGAEHRPYTGFPYVSERSPNLLRPKPNQGRDRAAGQGSWRLRLGTWLPNAPGLQILLLTYLVVMLATAVVWAGQQMPGSALRFLAVGGEIKIASSRGQVLAFLAPETPVTFTSSSGSITDRAGTLVQDYVPDGAERSVAAWYADRSRLARMLAQDEVRMVYRDAGVDQVQLLKPARQTLSDFSADVWLLLGGGVLVWIIGVWIWVLRARDWGVRMFALAALGIVSAALSGALFDARALSAHGGLLWALNSINLAGTSLYAAATLGQFASFPRMLVRPAWLGALIVTALAWALATAGGLLSLKVYYAGLLAHLPALVWLLWRQWRVTGLNALDRGALRWVGLITLTGAGLLAVMMAGPKLMRSPSVASDGMAFGPLVFVYAGMAIAVGRYRLLDLDLWAYRLLVAVLAALALLAIDAALVLLLKVETGSALSLSILVVASAYLPLRTKLLRGLIGTQAVSDADLFAMVTLVAFKSDPAERRAGWLDLTQKLFAPLEVTSFETGLEPTAGPQIHHNGLELALPPAAGAPAMLLRYRSQGQGRFRKADVQLTRQLLTLMRSAESAREGYSRGVNEERGRIARDLHDDVSARLLTSLHRDDVQMARGDVRAAMADIRIIINGLSGDAVALDQVVADLRHETAERLATAGLALHWPIGLGSDHPTVLDYRIYKVLISALRETVTNTLKHAKATQVTIEIHEEAQALRVTIADDGKAGSDTSASPSRGRGLNNIQARLQQIGGQVSFDRGVMGARTELRIPLAPAIG